MPEKAGSRNAMNQGSSVPKLMSECSRKRLIFFVVAAVGVTAVASLASCSGSGERHVEASGPTITVGVTKVVKKSLGRQITVSSELVPFQEIDVYAKESGYVKKLLVDYGARVKTGQVMAILEIPELEAQLQEDQAEIKNALNQVTRARHELERYQAQYKALHLQYTRLNGVFDSQPGIVAQQEVDDAQGKDLAASSQVDAGQAALEAAQSQLSFARAKLARGNTGKPHRGCRTEAIGH
jgi:multidrug efflux pump subunit AcrA (membrane-fusion protein)